MKLPGLPDGLRRNDPAPPPVRKRMVMLYCILRGDGSGRVTSRLYERPRAHRFMRLAKRWGHDVYTVRFGRVLVPFGEKAPQCL